MKKSMNVKEVASYAHLSTKTVYNLVYSKKIPFQRISEKKVIFHKDLIDKWLHNRKIEQNWKSEARKSKTRKDKNVFTRFRLNYLMYVIGLILVFSLGWMGNFLTQNRPRNESFDVKSLIDEAKLGDLQINQSFLEKDKIKIKLDYMSNIEFKGDIESAPIKPLLVYTLEKGNGDYATKSKTIDIIKPFVDDSEIYKALIHVMKNDESPALRMKAATVLTKVARMEDVKEAILDRLKNDDNEAVRFKALEIVETIVDEQILVALENLKEREKSDLIRNRAELILKKHLDPKIML